MIGGAAWLRLEMLRVGDWRCHMLEVGGVACLNIRGGAFSG